VQWHTVSVVVERPSVSDQIAEVAELMLADLEDICSEMDAAQIAIDPALGSDPAIAAEVSASNRANIRRALQLLTRRDDGPARADIPPEALDVVRTVVRRGVDLAAVFQAYRCGQNIAWRHWMDYAGRTVTDGPALTELLQVSSQRMFDFIDHVIGLVIAEAQREREEVLGGALARRTETVRLILDGAPMDRTRAGERLGYQLGRRHTAMVLWAEPVTDAVHGALEAAATVLARAVGAHRPLTVPAGTSTLWAWLGGSSDPDPDALRRAIAQAHPSVRVAVGPTRPGVTGFRRSHAAAMAIQRLLMGHEAGERLAFHRDLEVTALAAQDLTRAVEFVAATLGPLAADTPAAARLRDTLRVFLDEADNAPRAATRLHTHRNTVLQRVARATELLGRRPSEGRLSLELALELAHQLGPRVLTADS
jgi:DNA-binding PucR family transcriptional regulator